MKTLSRELIFGDCGVIVVEGSEGMVDAVSDIVSKVSASMLKRGKLGHDCIQAFTGMFADPKWKERFPGVKMTKSQIICPKGKLCIH